MSSSRYLPQQRYPAPPFYDGQPQQQPSIKKPAINTVFEVVPFAYPTDQWNASTHNPAPVQQPQPPSRNFSWMPVLLSTLGIGVLGTGLYFLLKKVKPPKSLSHTSTPSEAAGILETVHITAQNPNPTTASIIIPPQTIVSKPTTASTILPQTIVSNPTTASTMQAMHNVFGNNKNFLPYQVNILTPAQHQVNIATPAQYNPPDGRHAITYFQAVEQLKTVDNIYLGDLHGAWQKLLQHLSMAELIHMTQQTAQKFVTIHEALEEAYAFDEPDLATINHWVSQFKAALQEVSVVNDGRGIHLLGDIVGDRGQNDILTLLLLDHCKEKIKSRVFSNHDLGAIENYQQMFYNKGVGSHCAPAVSSFRAFELVHSNLADKAVRLAELKTLYENHFQQLTLIHYDEQTQTLSLHQAFNPQKLQLLLKAYIQKGKEQRQLEEAFKTGSKAEYKAAIETLNKRFQAYVKGWLKGDNKSLQKQFWGFYRDMWYTDSRRDFATQALPQDKTFPFYNPNAVTQVTFGHSGADKVPVVQGHFSNRNPWFYLLDQNACKPSVSAEQQFSRVFVPSLANLNNCILFR